MSEVSCSEFPSYWSNKEGGRSRLDAISASQTFPVKFPCKE